LRFTPGEWGAFVGRARLGDFDRSGGGLIGNGPRPASRLTRGDTRRPARSGIMPGPWART
jgi:hypothetical protein